MTARNDIPAKHTNQFIETMPSEPSAPCPSRARTALQQLHVLSSVVGIAAPLIAEQCEPGADVIAVSFRGVLLQHLLSQARNNL